MPRTRRELIDKVIANLGVLVPGQSPGEEAVSRVDLIIDPTIAMLLGKDVPVGNMDYGTPNPPQGGEIDDAGFLPIADCVAWQIGGEFNMSDSPSLKALAIEAEQTLRTIYRPARTRRTLRTDLQLAGRHSRAPINFNRGT